MNNLLVHNTHDIHISNIQISSVRIFNKIAVAIQQNYIGSTKIFTKKKDEGGWGHHRLISDFLHWHNRSWFVY